MKIGDKVTWESQAGGYRKTKIGEIVDVVPAGNRPSVDNFPDLHKAGVGWGRNHRSYVVRVGKKHYWPIVKNLVKK